MNKHKAGSTDDADRMSTLRTCNAKHGGRDAAYLTLAVINLLGDA